jgi:hypothetical protein
MGHDDHIQIRQRGRAAVRRTRAVTATPRAGNASYRTRVGIHHRLVFPWTSACISKGITNKTKSDDKGKENAFDSIHLQFGSDSLYRPTSQLTAVLWTDPIKPRAAQSIGSKTRSASFKRSQDSGAAQPDLGGIHRRNTTASPNARRWRSKCAAKDDPASQARDPTNW